MAIKVSKKVSGIIAVATAALISILAIQCEWTPEQERAAQDTKDKVIEQVIEVKDE